MAIVAMTVPPSPWCVNPERYDSSSGRQRSGCCLQGKLFLAVVVSSSSLPFSLLFLLRGLSMTLLPLTLQMNLVGILCMFFTVLGIFLTIQMSVGNRSNPSYPNPTQLHPTPTPTLTPNPNPTHTRMVPKRGFAAHPGRREKTTE